MSDLVQTAGHGGKVNKRVVLFVVVIAAFLTPFMSSAVTVAIPSIANEFAVDAVALSWILMVYLLAAAVVLIPLGKIADLYGRKKVFLWGAAVYTLASFLCGLSTSPTMLIAVRALQGVAGSMMYGTCVAILTSVYPASDRGRVLGMTVTSVYVASASGPFIGGLLTHYFAWRSTFFTTGVLGLLITGLVLWGIRGEWAGAQDDRLDVVGSILFGIAILAIMYGLSLLPAMAGVGLILCGTVFLAGFVRWEGKVRNPVLDLSLFRQSAVFTLSNLSALISYASTAALAFLLSLYLQYIKGLDPSNAGLVLLSQPLMMAIFSPVAGRLSDRIEPRILASIGMATTTAGLIMIAFLSASSDLTYVVAASTICGIGFGLFSSPNLNASMSSVDQRFYGIASAITSAMRMIGQMLSMAIAMLLIAAFVGQVQITPRSYPAFLTAFRVSFVVFAALCLIGTFASMARGKVHVGTSADTARAD